MKIPQDETALVSFIACIPSQASRASALKKVKTLTPTSIQTQKAHWCKLQLLGHRFYALITLAVELHLS